MFKHQSILEKDYILMVDIMNFIILLLMNVLSQASCLSHRTILSQSLSKYVFHVSLDMESTENQQNLALNSGAVEAELLVSKKVVYLKLLVMG